MNDEANDPPEMGAFSKLFASIITSTIWREPDHIRIVWVTMLAICNKRGHVAASVPGLAAVANVSIEHCVEALNKFLAPDEWSRTKENEGRRIREVRGGWQLLNYGYYRDMRGEQSDGLSMTPEAIRQRRKRDRDTRDSVTYGDDGVTSSASASASVGNNQDQTTKKDSMPGERPGVDRLAKLLADYDWGPWRDVVEGFVRSSTRAVNIMVELELWLTGEIGRRKTDALTLGEAVNAYAGLGEDGFKTNLFGGVVRGVHRNRDRNVGHKHNAAEDASIRQEADAKREREQDEKDRIMVDGFRAGNPAKYAEIELDAQRLVEREHRRASPRSKDVLTHAEIVKHIREARR